MNFINDEIVDYVSVGDPFPEFQLKGAHNGEIIDVRSGNFSNSWFLACSYPLNFTFVCPTELKAFNAAHSRFEEINCKMFWFSVDSEYAHLKWLSDIGPLHFPLVSDLKKELSKALGVLSEDGIAYRSTFIIDPHGIIRYVSIIDNMVGRSVDETVRLVSAFQTGGLCACNWQPGSPNLMES